MHACFCVYIGKKSLTISMRPASVVLTINSLIALLKSIMLNLIFIIILYMMKKKKKRKRVEASQ